MGRPVWLGLLLRPTLRAGGAGARLKGWMGQALGEQARAWKGWGNL